MGAICKVHEGTIELKVKPKNDLLDVLKQGIECSSPEVYDGIITEALFYGDGSLDIMKKVRPRCALVQRHMIAVLEALEGIYNVAKKRNYKEITEIFERKYYPVRNSK